MKNGIKIERKQTNNDEKLPEKIEEQLHPVVIVEQSPVALLSNFMVGMLDVFKDGNQVAREGHKLEIIKIAIEMLKTENLPATAENIKLKIQELQKI